MPWQTTGSQPLEITTAHPVWAEPGWDWSVYGVELIPFIVVLAFIFLLLSRWAMQARHSHNIGVLEGQVDDLRTDLEEERMDSAAMYSRLQATLDEVAFKRFCHHCLSTWDHEDPEPESFLYSLEDSSDDSSSD